MVQYIPTPCVTSSPNKSWIIAILMIIGLCGCGSDDNALPEPVPVDTAATTGIPQYQVMAVFAPGQLGDKGYADNVFSGMSQLRSFNDTASVCSIHVDFISRSDYADTREAMLVWLSNPVNPVDGHVYERRLLVLTEPFMVGWLSHHSDLSRPTDEVLMLKAIDDDVRAANDSLGLGSRLHALNLTATGIIRNFCRAIDMYIAEQDENQLPRLNRSNLSIFRLFSDDLAVCRDSVYETLREEFGESSYITVTSFYTKGSDGLPVSTLGPNSLEKILDFTSQSYQQMLRYGWVFPICNLGATNIALDYYMMSNPNDNFHPLLLDTGDSINWRAYILRPFGKALIDWVLRWMDNEVGVMPVGESHGVWDGYGSEGRIA